ncbi:MAG: nadC, partial [Noviherbaspirillum sp.]|nr:nadC [Noviherbaspirillum sp.]
MSTLNNPFAPLSAELAAALSRNIDEALAEDVGGGDVTGRLVPAIQPVHARVVVRESAVLCGAPWFEGVMLAIDRSTEIDWHYAEGDLMAADSVVCTIEASPRALLTA